MVRVRIRVRNKVNKLQIKMHACFVLLFVVI